MLLQEFLETFLTNYPQSRLIVQTKRNKDYFTNVVPLLFHIDVIINNHNQFLETVMIDYENDITINFEEEDIGDLSKVQFSVIDGKIQEYIQTRKNTKIDITLPLQFFKFLTT